MPCGKGDLKSCDFEHIKDELALTLEYLKNAISTKRHGVNILLYGPAGTGKTEFAKLVAKEIGLELFEVAYNEI
ncbi:AAA family ATPase [Campylobacter concisus]